MKITVIGGTGLIGSKLVTTLINAGHSVLAASPQSGINTITGQGLQQALRNVDVVVDVSNSPSFEREAVMEFFQTSTTNLLTMSLYANVKHYVALSVVGCDRLPDSDYLRAKVAQEELIRESGIPYTILRSTQFFEFAERIAQSGVQDGVIHMTPATFQPISADEVVEALADVVLGAPKNTMVEVAGPVPMPMYDFIKYYLDTTGDSRQIVSDPEYIYFGAVIKNESLVPGDNPRLAKTRYEDWLSKQLVKA